jgi:hypothetical protein
LEVTQHAGGWRSLLDKEVVTIDSDSLHRSLLQQASMMKKT